MDPQIEIVETIEIMRICHSERREESAFFRGKDKSRSLTTLLRQASASGFGMKILLLPFRRQRAVDCSPHGLYQFLTCRKLLWINRGMKHECRSAASYD